MLFTTPCRNCSLLQSTAEDSVSECQLASMGWRGKKTQVTAESRHVTREENMTECAQGDRGEREEAFQTQGQPVFLSVMTLSLKEAFHLKLQKLLAQWGGREKKDMGCPHPIFPSLQM